MPRDLLAKHGAAQPAGKLRRLAARLAAALLLGLSAPMAMPAAAQPFLEVHGDPSVPFRPVIQLDLDRYAGRWYEIARFPNRYQRNCHALSATYAPRGDGHYDVVATCPERRAGRDDYEATGVARLDGPGELSVGINAWMPFFRRSIFVLGVSADYRVAVLGEPRRKYGWIMGRSAALSGAERQWALGVLGANGYETGLLEYPAQAGE